MKFILKIIGAAIFVVVFVVVFGLALKNMEIVSLHSFFGYYVKSPLVGFLFGFFVIGCVCGVLAMVPTVFRYRREISQCKKELAEVLKANLVQKNLPTQAPQPDGLGI